MQPLSADLLAGADPRPVSSAIDAALDRASAQGVKPLALWASATVIAAIGRENDIAADEVATAYRSIPILERTDWTWGWVLSDAARQGTAELWVEIGDGGAASICRGAAAPVGVYRAWGVSAEVDAAWLELIAAHGDTLAFKTAALACEAIDRVAADRLNRLSQDELAA